MPKTHIILVVYWYFLVPETQKGNFRGNLPNLLILAQIPPKSAKMLHFRKKSGIPGNSTFLRFGGPHGQTDTQTHRGQNPQMLLPSRASGTKPVGGGPPPHSNFERPVDIS